MAIKSNLRQIRNDLLKMLHNQELILEYERLNGILKRSEEFLNKIDNIEKKMTNLFSEKKRNFDLRITQLETEILNIKNYLAKNKKEEEKMIVHHINVCFECYTTYSEKIEECEKCSIELIRCKVETASSNHFEKFHELHKNNQ
jgi:ribosomal protein L40E